MPDVQRRSQGITGKQDTQQRRNNGAIMTIPKVFHRIWFGPRVMPQRYYAYGQKWLDLHPGWTLKEWDQTNLPPLINQNVFERVGDGYIRPGAAKPESVVQVQQADITAYEIVYQHGGVYLNCDIEPLRNIEPLLAKLAAPSFAVWEVDNLWVSNAVMGGVPRQSFWEACILQIPDRMLRRKQINWQTGPALITETWRAHPHLLDVLPAWTFNPHLWNGQEAAGWENAYAEHHWGHKTPNQQLWGDVQ